MDDTTLLHRQGFNCYAELRSQTMAKQLGVTVESFRTGEWVGRLFRDWSAMTREMRETYIRVAAGELHYETNIK